MIPSINKQKTLIMIKLNNYFLKIYIKVKIVF